MPYVSLMSFVVDEVVMGQMFSPVFPVSLLTTFPTITQRFPLSLSRQGTTFSLSVSASSAGVWLVSVRNLSPDVRILP